jgi:hypothetical protein
MKKILIALLVLLLVVVAGSYYLINGAKTVDVEWTEEDFQSYLAKGNINFTENRTSVEDFILGNFSSVGVSQVETHVTNAEITAILNKAAKEYGVLKDIRVKFRDDGRVEASAKIGDNLDMIFQRYPEARGYESYLNTFKGKNVYFRCTLERVNNQQFDGVMEAASIGLIPLPIGPVNSYLERMGTEINSNLSRLEGFSAEEFIFDSSGLFYKGTIPKEVKVLN